MGTGPFAVPSFEAIRQAGYEIPLVVTRPERVRKSRKGPPPAPVRQWAQSHDLQLFDPASINDPEAIATVAAQNADVLFVCDYGQILSDAALQAARCGGLNLHGSLLPAYRGAAPVQWAMWKGETETGVSVIHMTPKLDGGPVVVRRSLKIDPHETAGELEARLADDGVAATLQSLSDLALWDGNSAWGEIQDPAQACKAPRLQKSDGQIDWTQSAAQIDCQVRAMQPWPTAFTTLKSEGRADTRITIRSLEPTDTPRAESLACGQIVVEGQTLFAAASDRLLQIHQLQPAGKKAMAAADFLRGHPHVNKAHFAS
ncbi:Methionyl-tRNA formyltransferase [Roseimaritima ulvae]|uniref:Methionyl-tRNA formyltransferase n=2 Tax=Roseimaritima ulvae TaxID=980254 RepID=A0A5B9QT39_9BACT|nr:Methionyl-tRNA formyltransferase [Roseimaritima ulvae]